MTRLSWLARTKMAIDELMVEKPFVWSKSVIGVSCAKVDATLFSGFTLSNIGNSDLKRVQTKSSISLLLPGSSSPNWLHGNASISKAASTSIACIKGKQ